MKAESDPERKPSEKSHEKAQRAEKLTGPIHAHPKGAALGVSSESDKSPSESSGAENEVASGIWDRELKAWSDAVTEEVHAGKLLDVLLRAKAPPEEIAEAEKAWHDALEGVKVAYAALPTVGDLQLTLRLATSLLPTGPKARASVGLGRALAGVTVESQRFMLETYKPRVCAASASSLSAVWSEWEQAEGHFREAWAENDLPLRTCMFTAVTHFRRLMRELLWLWFQAEETRAVRRAVKAGVPNDVLAAFYDEGAWCNLVIAPVKVRRELAEVRAATDELARAKTFRTTPFTGYVPMPKWIGDRAELELSGFLSADDDEETTSDGVSWAESEAES